MKKIKVLIVDDSALVRDILSRGLALDRDIEVVGTAGDPYIAAEKIPILKPDVLTLDVEMPKMNGVDFLKKLMPQDPIPVVMVSSLTHKGAAITLAALNAGAVDFAAKPSSDVSRGLTEMLGELCDKIKIAANTNISALKHNLFKSERPKLLPQNINNKNPKSVNEKYILDKLIVIGASTGGTVALRKLLSRLPENMPGIVIVQHMPPGFTKQFADTLNDVCSMQAVEGIDGEPVKKGKIIIAPGGLQLEVKGTAAAGYFIQCYEGNKVCGHSPSVEVLFKSAAKCAGKNSIGVILTGMGADGAFGLLDLRNAGGYTIAQDEATSVVYGMPKAAFECGAVNRVAPLDIIPELIQNATLR